MAGHQREPAKLWGQWKRKQSLRLKQLKAQHGQHISSPSLCAATLTGVLGIPLPLGCSKGTFTSWGGGRVDPGPGLYPSTADAGHCVATGPTTLLVIKSSPPATGVTGYPRHQHTHSHPVHEQGPVPASTHWAPPAQVTEQGNRHSSVYLSPQWLEKLNQGDQLGLGV